MKNIIYYLILIFFITSICHANEPFTTYQEDTHPMHWARFQARGLYCGNYIWGHVWNRGHLSDYNFLKWPGSQGYNYLAGASFYVAVRVIDLSSYKNIQVPYTTIPPN